MNLLKENGRQSPILHPFYLEEKDHLESRHRPGKDRKSVSSLTTG